MTTDGLHAAVVKHSTPITIHLVQILIICFVPLCIPAKSISLFVHTWCVINVCMLRTGQSNLSDHLSANLTHQKTILHKQGGLGLTEKSTL